MFEALTAEIVAIGSELFEHLNECRDEIFGFKFNAKADKIAFAKNPIYLWQDKAVGHEVLKSVGLSETKLVSALTERQRVTLAALLDAKRLSRQEA